MENLAFSGLSPTILVTIGIILIALESLTFSFVVLWFGVAFIIVGGISYLDPSLDLRWQLSLMALISMTLLSVLRTRAMKMMMKTQGKENNDNFLNSPGYGVIKDGKVYYKATYWDIEPGNKESLSEGDEVYVEKTQNNIAYIKQSD